MATYGDWQPWIDQTAEWLQNAHGLAEDFARSVAVFLAYCSAYHLSPRVTSGHRDPKKQAEMRKRWDQGQRGGLRARPADPAKSLHCRTSWLSEPAALAVDVVTSDDGQAAAIARALKLGVGADFRDPDPGHYFAK